MKVKELIDLLSNYDQDREIFVSAQGYNNCHYYDEETMLVEEDGLLILADRDEHILDDEDECLLRIPGIHLLLQDSCDGETYDVINCEYPTSADALQRVVDGIVDMYDDRSACGYYEDDCIYSFVVWYLKKLGFELRDAQYEWEKQLQTIKF